MAVQPAQISSGFGDAVTRFESLSPDDLREGYGELRETVGSARHVLLISLLGAARSLDWAPLDAQGRFDLTGPTARHAETLADRLPQEDRERAARQFAFVVSHRLHRANENAPFFLPEIAPDADRVRDPKAAFAQLREELLAGAVTPALHSWPCCLARTPWSQVAELLSELALRDGATLGARAIAVASTRRVLEVVGREHRHPVVTALFRALAASPLGADPAGERGWIHEGIEDPDAPVDPGAPATAGELETLVSSMNERGVRDATAAHLRDGGRLGPAMDALALLAAGQILAAEDSSQEVGETLVLVNALRDLDGDERGFLRPRVVAEAARLVEERIDRYGQLGLEGSTLADPVDAKDLALSIQELDTRLAHRPLEAVDAFPLRLHVALTDECRRAAPEARALYLGLAKALTP